MKTKNLIYNISIIIILWLMIYIWWIIAVFNFAIFILFYSSVFFIFYFLYKKYIKKQEISYKKYLYDFVKKTCLSLVILLFIIWWFGMYYNYFSPPQILQYTISDGQKTVIFQEMSHIASQKFYDTIKENIKKYKKQWYVYFFEWVKPGTKENMDNFDKILGIKFDKDLYDNFSKLYNLTFQNQKEFLNIQNNLDFNTDVNINWIIEQYKKKHINLTQEKQKIPVNISKDIIEQLGKLNGKQLQIMVFINRAFLAFIIKNDLTQDFIRNNFTNKDLFEIILEWRNKILTNEISKSKYNKIYITYWKMHFQWVLKLLQKQNPKWHITNKKLINLFQ